MSLANSVEHELIDAFVAAHPTLYIALSTADPGEDGSGIAEPSGNGYARLAVGDYTIVGGELSNDDSLQFALSTGNWGTITHAALFTADTGGTFLGSAAVTPFACPTNTLVVIPSGSPLVTIS